MGVAIVVLFVVNFIITVLGLAIISVGVFARYGSGTFKDEAQDVLDAIPRTPDMFGLQDSTSSSTNLDLDLGDYLEDVAIALVIVGGFVALIGIFGCFGICCKNKCLLIVYTIVVFLLIIVQIILLGLFFSGTLNSRIKDVLHTTIKEDFVAVDSYEKYSVAWNYFMLKFECCGAENYKDFNEAKLWKRIRRILRNNELNSNLQMGCFDKVRESLDEYEVHALGACGAAVVLQVIMALAAVLVLYSLSERDEYEYK